MSWFQSLILINFPPSEVSCPFSLFFFLDCCFRKTGLIASDMNCMPDLVKPRKLKKQK